MLAAPRRASSRWSSPLVSEDRRVFVSASERSWAEGRWRVLRGPLSGPGVAGNDPEPNASPRGRSCALAADNDKAAVGSAARELSRAGAVLS
jgi:hypothetical protein